MSISIHMHKIIAYFAPPRAICKSQQESFWVVDAIGCIWNLTCTNTEISGKSNTICE